MTVISNSAANPDSSVSEAFRSPSAAVNANQKNGLRLRIDDQLRLVVNRIRPVGLAALRDIFFPTATIVEIQGRLNVTLKIYPSHVQIDRRRWFSSSSVLFRFNITIPVYDEIGDKESHQIRIRSELAFLYPFVPMHVEVTLDDEVIFSQGKFDLNE